MLVVIGVTGIFSVAIHHAQRTWQNDSRHGERIGTGYGDVLFNEIKVIFDVPGCLFVLSVSDEELRAVQLAPVGGRDVFDSAIDEVVRVEPLDQEDARRLLAARVIGCPWASPPCSTPWPAASPVTCSA